MPTRVIQDDPVYYRDNPTVVQDSGASLTTIMLVTLVALIAVAVAVLLILHFTLGVA